MPLRPAPLPWTVWDFAPLVRPAWWAALALLLINDNLLKGGAVAPAWLTGKLSDFTFLIVAPVLLATLLPRAVPWRREAALAAVALVYTAADLSPVVSDAIVATAGRIGLRWQLWPDATDLIALLVLPLTWQLMRSRAPALALRTRSRPLLESAGVVVGAFACLATTGTPSVPQGAFLVNQTSQPREITATWLLRTMPCWTDLAEFATTLTTEDLDDPRRATLARGSIVSLYRPPAAGQPLAPQCPDLRGYGGNDGSCTGVLLQVGSELSVLARFPVRWYEDQEESRCKPQYSPKENPGPEAISLRERDGKVVLSVDPDSALRIVEVSLATIAARVPNRPGCRALLDEERRLRESAVACSSSSDCRRVLALPFPGRPLHDLRERLPVCPGHIRPAGALEAAVLPGRSGKSLELSRGSPPRVSKPTLRGSLPRHCASDLPGPLRRRHRHRVRLLPRLRLRRREGELVHLPQRAAHLRPPAADGRMSHTLRATRRPISVRAG
jgi:hypothetical protein